MKEKAIPDTLKTANDQLSGHTDSKPAVHPKKDISPALLKRVQEGDEEAFDRLYRQTFEPLTRFNELLLGDFEEAREIAQDVMVYIYTNREKIRPEENFRAYLYQRARMGVMDVFKHRKVEAKFLSYKYHSSDLFDDAPDDILENKELLLALDLYLENMPVQRRKVFEMFRIEGKSYEEISSELGISKNTVRNHIYAAKEGIKEVITLFILLFLGQ